MTKKKYLLTTAYYIIGIYVGSFLIHITSTLTKWAAIPTILIIGTATAIFILIVGKNTIDVIEDGFKKR